MFILKIVTTLIVVSLTPFVVIRDWRYHDRRTKKHHFITRFILFVWLLGCIGSVLLIWHETYLSGQLNNKINELLNGNKQLLANLDRYQQDNEAEAAEIKRLEEVTETVRGYSDMAALNPAGLPFKEGKGIRFDSPLSNALRDLYIIQNSKLHFKLGEEFENKYREIIQQFPRFPFAYLALAESLRHRGNPNWRDYANKAVSILHKTTKIEGHDHGHDDALHTLEWYLRE